MNDNPYAPPSTAIAEADASALHPGVPALWNPTAAVLWSLLLTPAFGAFLHMKNWRALGELQHAVVSRRWFIGVTITFTLLTLAGIWLPEHPAAVAVEQGTGLVLLLVWCFTAARTQIKHVDQRCGHAYPRRGWATALACGVAALIVLVLLATGLSLAAGAVFDVEPEGLR